MLQQLHENYEHNCSSYSSLNPTEGGTEEHTDMHTKDQLLIRHQLCLKKCISQYFGVGQPAMLTGGKFERTRSAQSCLLHRQLAVHCLNTNLPQVTDDFSHSAVILRDTPTR